MHGYIDPDNFYDYPGDNLHEKFANTTLYSTDTPDDILHSIEGICTIEGKIIQYGAGFIGPVEDSWYGDTSINASGYCVRSKEIYIGFHEPLMLNILEECVTNEHTAYIREQQEKYIEQQTSFIIDPKSKQILRYGEHPLGVYENIPACTIIQHNGRNYIDDDTFQNEKIQPIPITSKNQDIDFHPTSFVLGIVVTLILMLIVGCLRNILQKRKKT